MSQFLFQVSYTSDSWAKQVRDQGNVLDRIQPLLKECKGRVDSCFYAFGDYDLVLIGDFPGPEEAASFSMAVTAGGAVETIKTTSLLAMPVTSAAPSGGSAPLRPSGRGARGGPDATSERWSSASSSSTEQAPVSKSRVAPMTYLCPASRSASSELATLTTLSNGCRCPERTHTAGARSGPA